MNTYRNIRTGVVVVVASELSGDWELVEKKAPKKTTKKVEDVEDKEEE